VQDVIGRIELPARSPYEYPDSVWVSESPKIVLHVSPNKEAAIESSEAYVEVEGQKIPADIMIQSGRYAQIDKKGKHETVDDILFGGHLLKVTNKEVVIQIQEDYVFGEKYTTITLKRVLP